MLILQTETICQTKFLDQVNQPFLLNGQILAIIGSAVDIAPDAGGKLLVILAGDPAQPPVVETFKPFTGSKSKARPDRGRPRCQAGKNKKQR